MPLPGENAMNFRKLPKEKRNRLILVAMVTLFAAAGLYFGLIRRQHENLAHLAEKKAASAKKLQVVLDAIRRADPIKADLDYARTNLVCAESDIASGDLYAWIMNWLRGFKASYKVEIPQFSQLGAPVDMNLRPNFPYKQASLTVAGTAYFHDLGRFLADLENQFPHVRLVNLTVEASGLGLKADPEILSFKMDIVTLVKTNPS
jgi:hypothetical protein